MSTTAEHIKGSDLPESITIQEEAFSPPSCDDAHQAFFEAVEKLSAEDDLPENYSSRIKHYLYY